MLILAVVATLLSKVIGFVKCPKVDWPYDYSCFDDEYCCKDDQCCDNDLSFGAIMGISFGVFFLMCIVMIVCFIKLTQRGVISPINVVGQQAAVLHRSQCAEQTTEQTTRIEQPDPTTRLHQPVRVSYSSSRQQPITTWTTVNPSSPYGPMYGEHSFRHPSPQTLYTNQSEYLPPSTPPPSYTSQPE